MIVNSYHSHMAVMCKESMKSYVGYVVRRTLKKVSGKDEEAYDCLQQLL